MTKRLFVAGDVHDDRESLKAFTNYAQSQEADSILFCGDFSLRPYTAASLQDLLKSKKNAPYIEALSKWEWLHGGDGRTTYERISAELLEREKNLIPTPSTEFKEPAFLFRPFSEMADVKIFIDSKRQHNETIIKDMKSILDSSEIPYHVIPGNYDPDISDVFGENDLHGRTINHNGINIFGYGGADAYPEQIQLMVNLGEIVNFNHNELYGLLKTGNPDIAIIHNPPKGLCDDLFDGSNVGTPATTRYIHEESPKLVLSGHIHEAGPLGNNPHGVKGLASYENPNNGRKTIVVNPGNLGRFELLKFPSLETEMNFPFGTFSRIDIEDDGTPIRLHQYSLTGPEGKGNMGKVDEIGQYNL